MIEVIVPAIRDPRLLLKSLVRQTVKPDLVTIISNEVDAPVTGVLSYSVRVLGFKSDKWCYGEKDVVLRRNIGIWWAKGNKIIFQDDDQIAPSDMVETSVLLLRNADVIWGHHRYIDFTPTNIALVLSDSPPPPTFGRSRETSPNRTHGFYSCYGGMMAANTDFLREVGGYDMAFMGRHAGEDQQLGFRIDGSSVYIHEPPYAWHPNNEPERLLVVTNSCQHHTFSDDGLYLQCIRCPFRKMAPKPLLHLQDPFDTEDIEVFER